LGLSSCFILLGSGLVYTFTGLTNLESIYTLLSVSQSTPILSQPYLINNGVNLGLIFIFVGFLFKIAAAPLHNWAIDVYNDSPTIVTIWLTIMPKIAITIFLLELYTHLPVSITLDLINNVFFFMQENMISGNVVKYLLLISCLLSLILGTVVGLAQFKIKRLFAYSTVSHVGFLLMALAINSEKSIDSLIFYIIQYSITNLNTFLILIAFGYIVFSVTSLKNGSFKVSGLENITDKLRSAPSSSSSTLSKLEVNSTSLSLNNHNKMKEDANKDIVFISQLSGQFFSYPILALSFSICLFSMAGI
jgi:NADH-ubiquinone oxidoreductase chain 2